MPDRVYKAYSDHGLYFQNEVISNYCISLFSKPFVILSGISGTGKTKIAQLFNPYTPTPVKSTQSLEDKDYITFNVTDGILNGDGRGNFKKDHLKVLLTQKEYAHYSKERKKLKEKNASNNFQQLYTITLLDEEDNRHQFKFYVQRAHSPLVRARFKSKRSEKEPYDLQPYLKKKFKRNDTVILKKIEDKVFKIYKSDDKDPQVGAETPTCPDIQNIAFISVKSDWNDPSGLMGFYNIIDQSYHIGPFLKHILLAREFPSIPFFIILDEMNLSKVEFYLSDILSVLETRIPDIKTGTIAKEEQIVLYSASHTSGEFLETNDEIFDLIPSRLSIPQNIYITGTVNIDESTYMLSPKVLDRANVIEFNHVNIDRYINNLIKEKTPDFFTLKSLPDFTAPRIPCMKYTQTIDTESLQIIKQIHALLEKHNIHFGYRVLNEICLYLHNVKSYIGGEKNTMFKALDFQILQKILPKLSGSQIKLQEPLLGIIKILSGRQDISIDASSDAFHDIDIKASHYPGSLAKTVRMYEKLINQGFTHFIE